MFKVICVFAVVVGPGDLGPGQRRDSHPHFAIQPGIQRSRVCHAENTSRGGRVVGRHVVGRVAQVKTLFGPLDESKSADWNAGAMKGLSDEYNR